MKANFRRMAPALALALAWHAADAVAYETPVHQWITFHAFKGAVGQRNFLVDLGLLHYLDSDGVPVMQAYEGRTPFGWTLYGSKAEDDIPRSLHHFYDPLAPEGSGGLFHRFNPAPTWALGHPDNPTYSLPGTRDSLYRALTTTDTLVRSKMWAEAFRGLGQFNHLLQDMAQPQHVRNDDHFSLTESYFDLFPDYSRYEKRTLFMLATGRLRFGGYPVVELPTYRSYWNTSDNRGLAQQTNLNFVSEGTNLQSGLYASPVAGLETNVVNLPKVFDVFGREIPGMTDIKVRYATYSYHDVVGGGPVTNDKLAAYSLLDFERMRRKALHVYTLYNTNHESYADILVPRAVGYSAGLMSRFFRGTMEISPPDEGIYSVVDHSQVKQTDALNGFVGFDTIKLKVRSTGKDAMSGGKLVAVAKFHRNGCYQEDLSGEFQQIGGVLTPPCPSYRTSKEEIIVSNEIASVTLDATPKPFGFTFAKQIPINATDLYIQLVYRGKLGPEDPDEVVVATKDVFEPSYLAFFNSTDNVLYKGVFRRTTDTPPPELDTNNDGVIDPQWDKTNLSLLVGFTGSTSGGVATVLDLPPERYARLAFLSDRQATPVSVKSTGAGLNGTALLAFEAETNQLDFKNGTYFVASYEALRGIMSYNSLTYYRFFGSPEHGDLNSLPALPTAKKPPFAFSVVEFKP